MCPSGHPHSVAQQGYYMMFALNTAGVPSIAKWIHLQ
ncbi:MAG: galactose oxidase-like domain-containing protein [Candidatus Limnocylindria bacterium]